MKRIININGLGEVVFAQTRQNKNINISRRAFKRIRISFPLSVSFSRANDFLMDNLDKLKEIHLKQLKKEKIIFQKKDQINVDEAMMHLNKRIDFLIKKHDFSCNKITFRNQTTCWGSCSYQNNISLNIKIYKLPQHLQDYVIIHEFVHTKIKNHSNVFWNEMEKIYPDSIKFRAELKQYSPNNFLLERS